VLELGRGRSTLVRTASGEDVLVDAGAGRALERRLRGLGVSRASAVAVTLDDRDHVAGLAEVVRRMGARLLALPRGGPPSEELRLAARVARGRGAAVVWPAPGDELACGEARLLWLVPEGALARRGCLGLAVDCGDGFEVVLFRPGWGRPYEEREGRLGGAPARPEVLVLLPPARPGASPSLTAERVRRDVSAVLGALAPGAVLVPLSRAEGAFAGAAAALRAVEDWGGTPARTDLAGTIRALPLAGTPPTRASDGSGPGGGVSVERWDGSWQPLSSAEAGR
jgi:hypothetical protein